MSVLVSDRKESKFEPIVYASELHNMLREFMQRNFGIKNIRHFVRSRYIYGKDDIEDYDKYYYLLRTHKKEIDHLSTLMTNNVRAANSLYPTSMHEYEKRRDFQNFAIINLEQIIKELQSIVEIFEVDLNTYNRYVKAIDLEISLIKKWRQKDNKIKSRISQLQGSI